MRQITLLDDFQELKQLKWIDLTRRENNDTITIMIFHTTTNKNPGSINI